MKLCNKIKDDKWISKLSRIFNNLNCLSFIYHLILAIEFHNLTSISNNRLAFIYIYIYINPPVFELLKIRQRVCIIYFYFFIKEASSKNEAESMMCCIPFCKMVLILQIEKWSKVDSATIF